MYKEILKIMFEKSIDKTFAEDFIFDFYGNRVLLGDYEVKFETSIEKTFAEHFIFDFYYNRVLLGDYEVKYNLHFESFLTLLYIDGKIWNKTDISRMFGK